MRLQLCSSVRVHASMTNDLPLPAAQLDGLDMDTNFLLGLLNEHRRKRAMLSGFAQSPLEYFNALVAAQVSWAPWGQRYCGWCPPGLRPQAPQQTCHSRHASKEGAVPEPLPSAHTYKCAYVRCCCCCCWL